jgi:crossover junction endodeoxyribonuclease RuvC
MAKPLRVLGIDPGSVVCGYGLVRRQGSVLTLEDCGVFRPKRQAPFPERLRFLYEGLEALIAETTPDAMAIESVFFARHARSALQLGHARGVLLLAAARADVPIFEYPPAAVKKAVTGDGAALKEQVRTMVELLLKTEVKGPMDASDALAVAIHHAQVGELAGRLRQLGDPKRGGVAPTGGRLRKVKG